MKDFDSLAAEAAAIRAELDGRPSDRATGERIRERLIDLGREIERRIAELEGLREALRPVASEYKKMFREAPSGLRRTDHLGGSSSRERGWSALAAGDYAEAVRHLRRSAEFDAGDPRTQTLLAWALAAAGDLKRADAVLAEVLETFGDREPMVRLVMAFVDMREGRLVEAHRALTGIVDERADRTAVLYAYLYLGITHQQLGARGEAQRLLRRAIERSPNLTEAYWELGKSHLEDGRRDLALAAWRAGGENPFNPWGERCRSAAIELEREGQTGHA